MKANELRIGNWIHILDSDCDYKLMNTDDLSLVDCGSGSEGIPLTEEWLEKLGFFDKYKSVHTRWSKNGFSIQQASDEDDEGGSIPVKQEFSYEFKYDIKYVHQLQNLYFALTGEELVIKQIH
jgi:hypothetical protein